MAEQPDLNNVVAGEAKMEMTIQVKRKDTGLVEEYHLTSIPDNETQSETKEK